MEQARVFNLAATLGLSRQPTGFKMV